MVFSSYIFLFFFLPITLLVYYLLPKRCKNGWLLLVSILFYSWNAPKYTVVLFASILVNWAGAYLIGKTKEKYKKRIIFVTISLNLAGLIYFKYMNFIIDNMEALSGREFAWNEVVLPLGISFFTFQGMSYVIDVYRGDAKALPNPLDVALYISLFPQLVAGPIVRFKSVAAEIKSRRIDLESVAVGFRRFVYGLAKKILLADTFGMIADEILAGKTLRCEVIWIAIFAYTLQIFYDFSGYSDMAIGMGRMLGFHFGENFDYPYLSKSVTEFWRRWHISLSTWFRDYIYIPLGGNRVKPLRHILNLGIVWALTGIWHGANWTFLTWGVYYGILLICEKYLVTERIRNKIPGLVRWLITFIIIMVGWTVFRADNISCALNYLCTMFGFKLSAVGRRIFIRYLINYKFFWLLGVIGMFPVKKIFENCRIKNKKWIWAFAENAYICILLFLSVMQLIAGSYNAFNYFQF